MKQFLMIVGALLPYCVMAQLATEPSTQPTNLVKNGLDKPYVYDLELTGSGANGYLVVRSTEPISFTPSDGVQYTKGEGVGNAKVISAGASTFIRVWEVLSYTNYYFEVYAYNINGSDASSINYLTTNPLATNIMSAGDNPFGYYQNIDFKSSTVVQDLTNLINPHTIVAYDDFASTIIGEVYERDTVNGQKVAEGQYSGEKLIYNAPINFFTQSLNREHRMPFSWINFNNLTRNDFELTPEGADYHALELVLAEVNSERLNYPYSSNVVNVAYNRGDFNQGKDSRNIDVAEIWDARKGDAARALFYIMLAYDGKYGESWGLANLLSDATDQQINQLLDWHWNDPPDGFERARHAWVAEKQGNRNPFIDFPELAACVKFVDMTLTGSCAAVSVGEESMVNELQMVPNPTTDGKVQLILSAKDNKTVTYTLYNMMGQEVYTRSVDLQQGNNTIQLNHSDLQHGVYLYTISDADFMRSGKLLLN